MNHLAQSARLNWLMKGKKNNNVCRCNGSLSNSRRSMTNDIIAPEVSQGTLQKHEPGTRQWWCERWGRNIARQHLHVQRHLFVIHCLLDGPSRSKCKAQLPLTSERQKNQNTPVQWIREHTQCRSTVEDHGVLFASNARQGLWMPELLDAWTDLFACFCLRLPPTMR